MNQRTYCVTHWGLPPKDQRLVEIMFRYSHADRHRLAWNSNANGACEVLIIDADRPNWNAALAAYRQRHGNPIPITVSTDGQAGPGPYRIVRHHLLAHLLKVVDEALTIEVDHLGSRDVVTSAPGDRRAAFTPAVPAARSVCAHSDPAGATGSRLSALVVDDSVTVRAQVEAVLRPLGMCVIQAGSACEAERMLVDRHIPVDLMLLDVVMPGMDGYQFCSAVRRNGELRRLPIIMLTSRSSPFDRARGALAGCNAFLTKPIAAAQLREVIQKVLLKGDPKPNEMAQRFGPLFHAA